VGEEVLRLTKVCCSRMRELAVKSRGGGSAPGAVRIGQQRCRQGDLTGELAGLSTALKEAQPCAPQFNTAAAAAACPLLAFLIITYLCLHLNEQPCTLKQALESCLPPYYYRAGGILSWHGAGGDAAAAVR
jgi:hypothetical protein